MNNMVGMEPPKRQGWTITVRAKSKGLDLRLATSNILPHWGSGGERVSFFIRLRHRFLLRVESENQSPSSRVPATVAKPFQFLKETFRRRRWFSRKHAAAKSGSKGSKTGSLLGFSNQHKRQGLVAVMVIGSLFLLSRSAYEKYQKGIVIHAFASIVNLIVLLRAGRINLLLLRVAGMFATFGFSFSYLTYAGYLPIIAWRLWSYIFTFGYLVVFSQLIGKRWHVLQIRCHCILSIDVLKNYEYGLHVALLIAKDMQKYRLCGYVARMDMDEEASFSSAGFYNKLCARRNSLVQANLIPAHVTGSALKECKNLEDTTSKQLPSKVDTKSMV